MLEIKNSLKKYRFALSTTGGDTYLPTFITLVFGLVTRVYQLSVRLSSTADDRLYLIISRCLADISRS